VGAGRPLRGRSAPLPLPRAHCTGIVP